MPDNSNVFQTVWNVIISTISTVLGWFFDFLTTFGAVGVFIVVVVLYIFLSFVILGSNTGSDTAKSKGKNSNNSKQKSND